MTISFLDALGLLKKTPSSATPPTTPLENVPVIDAVGRISATPYLSPRATPVHSTSAMDGFLICSSATSNATPDSPAIFTVIDTIVPGHKPSKCAGAPWKSRRICLEMMTGGQFPEGDDEWMELDACVPVERVSVSSSVESNTGQATKIIAITHAVPPGAHRRVKGSDLAIGQPLILAGQRILSPHLLPLLSAGVETISVVARPRVGIWSTGNEFVSDASNARTDINGPYLMALCRDFDADPVFLGYLDDRQEDLTREIKKAAETGDFDVLVTTGAVSAGKFDFVRPALISCGADILFHGVDIRPGHPVLFASLPSNRSADPVAFFGLPGNPGASAACFRFLLVPFLRQIQLRDPERPVIAEATRQDKECRHQEMYRCNTIFSSRKLNDCFLLGRLTSTTGGRNVVEVCAEISSAKLEPFISANCWVHIYPSCSLLNGEMVECYPLTPMVS